MQGTANSLISNYEGGLSQNRHFVDFDLTDEQEVEMLLSKGEAMFDLVL